MGSQSDTDAGTDDEENEKNELLDRLLSFFATFLP